MANASLDEILERHYVYEVIMLVNTFGYLRLPQPDDTIRNALIESFCIHARSLIDFYNNKQAVHAKSFADGAYTPFVGKPIRKILIQKLNTQIAHMSFQRTIITAEKIGAGDRLELLRGVLGAHFNFVNHLTQHFDQIWQPAAQKSGLAGLTSPPSGQAAGATNAISIATVTNSPSKT
jgi:hypothetical protein